MIHQTDKNPVVTVVCLVYNHESYLKECLEGFVTQQTSFPFQVIVHDDLSTDRSAEIITEYAKKYPDIIIPILEIENQYSKHDGSLKRAIDPHIKGKYVALCEGDDFWTDRNKLQTQVDFMEQHPECSLCFHPVNILREDKPLDYQDPLYSHLHEGFYDANEIIKKWTIPTCSSLMIKEAYLSKPNNKNFVVGDNVLWLNCYKYGKAYCLPKKMGTYRRTTNGWILRTYSGNKTSIAKSYERYYIHLELLKQYFPGIADKQIRATQLKYLAHLCKIYLTFYDKKAIEKFKMGINMGKLQFLKELFNSILLSLKVRINRHE